MYFIHKLKKRINYLFIKKKNARLELLFVRACYFSVAFRTEHYAKHFEIFGFQNRASFLTLYEIGRKMFDS